MNFRRFWQIEFSRALNRQRTHAIFLLAAMLAGAGCRTTPKRRVCFEPRRGDEIVVAGKMFHTGTPVVLWMDPGGYDAYRVERRFSPFDKSDWEHSTAEVRELRSPNRYNLRGDLTPEERRARARRRLGFAAAAKRRGPVRDSFRRVRRPVASAMLQGAARFPGLERPLHAGY